MKHARLMYVLCHVMIMLIFGLLFGNLFNSIIVGVVAGPVMLLALSWYWRQLDKVRIGAVEAEEDDPD